MHADGVTPVIRVATTGDLASDFLGVVAEGLNMDSIDSEAGYVARYYSPGKDVPIIPLEGAHCTALCEAAVDVTDDVWIRVIATGSEVAGSLNDTPDFTAEVHTVTPTAANTTVYAGSVQVFDERGFMVAQTIFNYTSDGSATATEIVTGITADLDAGTVVTGGFIVNTGTTTLIMTAQNPLHTIAITTTAAGILEDVLTTAAACDHVKLPGAKFTRTISAAGTCAVQSRAVAA
jgi:hypothetical protein